jgi:hypothetical protein
MASPLTSKATTEQSAGGVGGLLGEKDEVDCVIVTVPMAFGFGFGLVKVSRILPTPSCVQAVSTGPLLVVMVLTKAMLWTGSLK